MSVQGTPIQSRIRSEVTGHPIVLFMKGTPQFPMCGFSSRAVQALKAAGKEPIVQRYHLRGDKRDNTEFMLPGSPRTPVVYHLFGDAQEPGSLVLSENDLLDFLVAIVSERPPLPNSLVRALKRVGQSFLFVGFGIRHW